MHVDERDLETSSLSSQAAPLDEERLARSLRRKMDTHLLRKFLVSHLCVHFVLPLLISFLLLFLHSLFIPTLFVLFLGPCEYWYVLLSFGCLPFPSTHLSFSLLPPFPPIQVMQR